MTLDAQLLDNVRAYREGSLSFDDLGWWAQRNVEALLSLPEDSAGYQLAGAILLIAYEKWQGDRDDASASQDLLEEIEQILGSPSRT